MKKRFLWLIPAGYFPYHVLLWVRLMRRGVFGVLYENAAPKVLGSFGVVYLTALIGVLVWTIGSAVAKDDPLLRVRTVRTLKLAQIPAYLLFLQACFIFPFSIMTIPISTFYIPLCLLAILLTGICGAAAAASCCRAGAYGKGMAVLLGLMQFLFLFDLLAIHYAAVRMKKRRDCEKLS